MGYMHIDNLYKNQDVLLFKELYALEKIHGTSARVSWRDGVFRLSPGDCKAVTFEKMFDADGLVTGFEAMGHAVVTVYGEQYGGRQQHMSNTYGKEGRFIGFDVKVGDTWLRVPDAEDVCGKLGIEFVHYVKIPAEMEAIDAQRDADSVQAVRNGVGEGKMREGIVLRPLVEVTNNRGGRFIAKHKGKAFSETKTPRKVGDPLKKLAGEKAALEWVTDMRLSHVLDKLTGEKDKTLTGAVIRAMMEDVTREGGEEVIMVRETKVAISKAAAGLYHKWLDAKKKATP
jgi:hypothetical protein